MNSRILLLALLFGVCFTTSVYTQTRFGFEGGCALEERPATYPSDRTVYDIMGMHFGLRGEYTFRGVQLFTSPGVFVSGNLNRIELPVGAKYLFLNSSVSPYLSGGLAAVYNFPVTVSTARWTEDFGHDSWSSVTYNPLNMRFVAAVGVELGSLTGGAFALELRYNRRIGTLAGVNPPGKDLGEFSIITGFMFR